jgi:hypothetical protein
MPSRACATAAALLIATVAILCPARAQTVAADRLAAAKEMMQVAKVERQLDQVMPLLLDQLRESFRLLVPDQRAVIDNVFEQLQAKFATRRSELIEEVAGIYAQRLDAQDMKAITEFFKSPAGTRFLEAQPQILQESIAAGQRWGQKIGREIDEEARRELKKRGIDL